MLQIIEQKQFNSPDFCKEVTTCVKEYAKLKKEYEELKMKHAVLQSEEQKPKGFFSSIMSQFKN